MHEEEEQEQQPDAAPVDGTSVPPLETEGAVVEELEDDGEDSDPNLEETLTEVTPEAPQQVEETNETD